MLNIQNLPWYKRLELFRTSKNWSQYKAAEQCGTNQKNYWNWENGKTYPRKIFRKTIAHAFGVPESDIFPDTK